MERDKFLQSLGQWLTGSDLKGHCPAPEKARLEARALINTTVRMVVTIRFCVHTMCLQLFEVFYLICFKSQPFVTPERVENVRGRQSEGGECRQCEGGDLPPLLI